MRRTDAEHAALDAQLDEAKARLAALKVRAVGLASRVRAALLRINLHIGFTSLPLPPPPPCCRCAQDKNAREASAIRLAFAALVAVSAYVVAGRLLWTLLGVKLP